MTTLRSTSWTCLFVTHDLLVLRRRLTLMSHGNNSPFAVTASQSHTNIDFVYFEFIGKYSCVTCDSVCSTDSYHCGTKANYFY